MMPKVGSRHYPYTEEGMAAAKKARKARKRKIPGRDGLRKYARTALRRRGIM